MQTTDLFGNKLYREKHGYKFPCIATATLLLLTFIVGCTFDSEDQAQEQLDGQRSSIQLYFSGSDDQLSSRITLEERMGEDGKPCLIGVLEPELDGLLNELADAYNLDPETEHAIIEDELRRSLTVEIEETSTENNEQIKDFLLWTSTPASLVFSGHVVYADGTEHFENETVIDSPSNFMFILNADSLYPNFKFSWK